MKVQLAQAELQVITLQDTLQTQKENLNNLMGRDITSDFGLASVPEALPEEQSLDLARQSALAGRTEIRQAQFKIDQAVYARRLQKAQYIPQVGLQYLLFSPFSIQGLPNNINSLGISMKWDLYDWGNKRHLLDEKTRNIEQGKLNLTETRSQVTVDLDNRFRKLREARARSKSRNSAKTRKNKNCRSSSNSTSKKPPFSEPCRPNRPPWLKRPRNTNKHSRISGARALNLKRRWAKTR